MDTPPNRAGWAAAAKRLLYSPLHPLGQVLAWSKARAWNVAEAGGWRDPNTLLKCYQQPDEATMTRVVLEPGKLREA